MDLARAVLSPPRELSCRGLRRTRPGGSDSQTHRTARKTEAQGGAKEGSRPPPARASVFRKRMLQGCKMGQFHVKLGLSAFSQIWLWSRCGLVRRMGGPAWGTSPTGITFLPHPLASVSGSRLVGGQGPAQQIVRRGCVVSCQFLSLSGPWPDGCSKQCFPISPQGSLSATIFTPKLRAGGPSSKLWPHMFKIQ